MTSPIHQRTDLIVGRPPTDAEAAIRVAQIAARARIRVAWIGLAGVVAGPMATALALHFL